MAQQRTSLWSWTPALLDDAREGLRRQGALSPAEAGLRAEGATGYRRRCVLSLAQAALSEPNPADAAWCFQEWTDADYVSGLSPQQRKLDRLRRIFARMPLFMPPGLEIHRRPGRPKGLTTPVVVRTVAIQALHELCGMSFPEAISAWNSEFHEGHPLGADGARFRADRRRVKDALTPPPPPPPPKRGRGRPRKHPRPGELSFPDLSHF